MKTKSVKRQSKFKSQKGRFEEGIELWTSYYRANISRFIQDYLEINIFWFQAIVLHLFHLKQFSFFVGSRGLGKTFLTGLYCCAVAILYPETKIYFHGFCPVCTGLFCPVTLSEFNGTEECVPLREYGL